MALALNALKDRNHLNPLDVEDVIVGCVTAYGEQAMCIARMSVLAAEWPNDSTGVTINRFCGSGQQAVNFAAMGIKSGEQELVVAGGVESMSRVPLNADRGGSEFDAEMSFQGVEIRLTLPKFLPMLPIGREYAE